MPRPMARKLNARLGCVSGYMAIVSLIMPLQVVLKLPAKKPYVIANIRSNVVEDIRPRKIKTKVNALIVEIYITVVIRTDL